MLVRLLAVLMLLVILLPPAASAHAQSLGEISARLEEVREERVEIEERIGVSTRALASVEERIDQLRSEEQELRERVDDLRRELEALGSAVAQRVRETYKHGSAIEPIAVFLGSQHPEAALSRAQVIERVVAGDEARTEELQAAQTRVRAAEELLAERGRDLEVARREQAQVIERLRADFEELEELESRLTAEERQERERLLTVQRQRERDRAREAGGEGSSTSPAPTGSSTSPAPTGSGGMACPLDRPRHFIDSWGYARSGGRSHRGTDIMGPKGIPVRAITDGTWEIQSRGASAGMWGILHGADGHRYWYLHLDRHTVGDGARVRAGEQVATNGATGNATPGAEHVHFELHPGGGSAVNPYPLLQGVCG